MRCLSLDRRDLAHFTWTVDLMAFAEQAGFCHPHIHVVPRPEGLPFELRGAKIFGRLNPGSDQILLPKEIIRLSERLAHQMG